MSDLFTLLFIATPKLGQRLRQTRSALVRLDKHISVTKALNSDLEKADPDKQALKVSFDQNARILEEMEKAREEARAFYDLTTKAIAAIHKNTKQFGMMGLLVRLSLRLSLGRKLYNDAIEKGN